MTGSDGAELPIDPDLPPRPGVRLADHVDVLPAIAVGGALGSLARWGLAEAIPHPAGGFAWDTLITNISGAFLLAVLMVLIVERWPEQRYIRPFLGVGVLGGFTTFSTWMLDGRSSWVAHPATALAYLALTLVGGLLATVAGLALTPRAPGTSRVPR